MNWLAKLHLEFCPLTVIMQLFQGFDETLRVDKVRIGCVHKNGIAAEALNLQREFVI